MHEVIPETAIEGDNRAGPETHEAPASCAGPDEGPRTSGSDATLDPHRHHRRDYHRDSHIEGVISCGPEQAPPIIFIHGTRRMWSFWRSQLEALRATNHCIALDLPGHGSLARQGFRPTLALQRLARVVDEVAGGRALLVGHSLGGYLAIEFAAANPGQVSGLVLAGATREPFAIMAGAPRAIGTWVKGQVRETREHRRAVESAAARGVAIDTDAPAADGLTFRGSHRAVLHTVRRRYRRIIRRYPGPVLILNGREDELMRSGERGFRAAVPHARLVVLDGAGHDSILERPEAFSRAVAEFVRDIGWSLGQPAG